MIIKTKKVYYCEFCKKHGLSAGCMSTHEKHCTANPNRMCRMCNRTESIQPLIDKFKKQQIDCDRQVKIEDIMNSVENCPACALTIIRGIKSNRWEIIDFDFKKELEEWWADKNEEEYQLDIHGYNFN